MTKENFTRASNIIAEVNNITELLKRFEQVTEKSTLKIDLIDFCDNQILRCIPSKKLMNQIINLLVKEKANKLIALQEEFNKI